MNMIKKKEVKSKYTCEICGKAITEKRKYKYCSTKCRNRHFYLKNAEYFRQWQMDRRDKIASVPNKNKVQCLVCGKYYVQVCSHVIAKHKFKSAREYKEYFDLERKKGVIPRWYKKMKGDLAKENGTEKNLKAGKKFWFKKGDKRAGDYVRSHITLDRLRNLHKLRKYAVN